MRRRRRTLPRLPRLGPYPPGTRLVGHATYTKPWRPTPGTFTWALVPNSMGLGPRVYSHAHIYRSGVGTSLLIRGEPGHYSDFYYFSGPIPDWGNRGA